MAAQKPVFFDGRQLRRLSASEWLDDTVLSTNVILADGSRSFSATVAGTTPVLGADLSTKNYVDWAVTDASWHAPVEDAQTTPPGGPTEGQRWIVTATATGAWAGQENKVAVWRNSAWVFITPTEGWAAFNKATNFYVRFDGSAWLSFASGIAHNSTSGLQGGLSNDYFHITSAQHTELTAAKAANTIYAGPVSGGADFPSFRAMVLADIPAGTNGYFLRTVGGAASWVSVTAATISAVPTSRSVNTGSGLSGGGDLSADRTISWDGLGVKLEGSAVATRRFINIVGGRAEVADDDPDVKITLPDPALMAMVFGG